MCIHYPDLFADEDSCNVQQEPHAFLAAAVLALEPPAAVQHAVSLILLALHITQV